MADRGFVGVFAAVVLTFVVIGSLFRKSDPVETTPPQGGGEPISGEGVVYEKTASNGTTFAVNEIISDQDKRVYQVGTSNDGVFEGVLTGSSFGNLSYRTKGEAVAKVDSLVYDIDNADPSGGPVSEPSPSPVAPPTLPPPRNDPTNPFPYGGLGSGVM